MNNKKMLLNAMLYVINNILVKAFQFFLVPIYTAYLTTAEYGTSNLISSFSVIGGVLLTLSIGSATSRFYVENKEDAEQTRILFSSLYFFTAIWGLGCCFLLFIGKEFLVKYIFGGVDFYPLIASVIVSLWLQGMGNQYKAMLQAMQNAKLYTVVTFGGFCIQLSLNIYFIVFCRIGVLGIVYGVIFANVATVLFSLLHMYKKQLLSFKVKLSIITQALKYSIPLIPHSLSSSIAQFLSRVFIGNTYSLSHVGIYGLASQFGNIIDIIQSSVHSAYLPWFFEQMNNSKEDASVKIREVLPFLLGAYNLIFLGIALFSQEVILLIANERYLDAWKLIPFFVLAYAIKTPYYFYVSFLFYNASKVRYIFVATLLSSILNVVFSVLFIPRIGMYGSILADILAIIVQVMIVILLCKNENKAYFSYGMFIAKTIPMIVLSFMGLLPGYILHMNNFSLLIFGYKSLIWGLYGGLFLYKYQKNISKALSKFKGR